MTPSDRVSGRTTAVVAVVAVIAGVAAAAVIPVRHVTGDRSTFVEAVVEAEGMVRDAVIREVTVPIERRLASLAAVQEIRSETADGRARVRFDPGNAASADEVRLEAERRLAATPPLPGRISVAIVRPREPVAAVLLSGGTPGGTLTLARDRLVPELLRIDGVERIEVRGGSSYGVVVVPQPDALATAGLTALDLVQRLEHAGRAVPAGRIRDGAVIQDAVVLESVRSLEELGSLRAGAAGGGVPLDRLAAISVEPWWRTAVLTSGPGRPAAETVAILIHAGDRANALRVSRAVRERAAGIAAGQQGVRVSVDDRTAPAARLAATNAAWTMAILLAAGAAALALFGRRAAVALFVTAAVALLVVPAIALAAGVAVDPLVFAALPLTAALAAIPPAVVLAGHGVRPLLPVVAAAATIAVALELSGATRSLAGGPAVVAAAAFAASALAAAALTPKLAGAVRPPGLASGGRLSRSAAVLAAVAAFVAAIAVAVPATRGEPFAHRDVVSVRFTFTDSPVDEALRTRLAAVHRRVAEAAAGDCSVLTEWQDEPLASGPPGASRVHCHTGAADAGRRVRRALSVVPSLSASFDLHSSLRAPDDTCFYVTSWTHAAALASAQNLAARAATADIGLSSRAHRRRVLLIEPLPAAAIENLEAQFATATLTAQHGRVSIPGLEPEVRVKPAPGLDPGAVPLRLRDGSVVRAGAVARVREIMASPPAVRYGGYPAAELHPRSAESADDVLRVTGRAAPPGAEVHVAGAHARRIAAAAALPLLAAAGAPVFLMALVLLRHRREVLLACSIAAYASVMATAAILLRGSGPLPAIAMCIGAAAAVWFGGTFMPPANARPETSERRTLWPRAL